MICWKPSDSNGRGAAEVERKNPLTLTLAPIRGRGDASRCPYLGGQPRYDKFRYIPKFVLTFLDICLYLEYGPGMDGIRRAGLETKNGLPDGTETGRENDAGPADPRPDRPAPGRVSQLGQPGPSKNHSDARVGPHPIRGRAGRGAQIRPMENSSEGIS